MNFTRKAWAKISTFLVPKVTQPSDKGAGFLEYAAILIIVAAIAVAIYELGLHTDISGKIGDRIDEILQGPGISSPGSGDSGDLEPE